MLATGASNRAERNETTLIEVLGVVPPYEATTVCRDGKYSCGNRKAKYDRLQVQFKSGTCIPSRKPADVFYTLSLFDLPASRGLVSPATT